MIQSVNSFPSAADLPVIKPGLSIDRQCYLFNRIRQFVKEECKDITCPQPQTQAPPVAESATETGVAKAGSSTNKADLVAAKPSGKKFKQARSVKDAKTSKLTGPENPPLVTEAAGQTKAGTKAEAVKRPRQETPKSETRKPEKVLKPVTALHTRTHQVKKPAKFL